MVDVTSDKYINYVKKQGHKKRAKRILEDPEYAAKIQKIWDKREAKKEKAEKTTSERTGGWQSGGRALRGYGRAYMKGGKV